MIMKSKIYIQIILFAAFTFLLSSCGVWYNFKAYFNSYYNAKVLFDQAEANIEKIPRDLFSFFEPNIQSQDINTLTKVNEKCSKIMQFDTHSGYFIDALWLSGKAFYYQRDYVKAERKFKELLNAEQDSVKLLEANLWLGKSELQLRNFDEAVKILDQVAEGAIKAGEDDIFSEAVIKQIGFLMYKERNAEAIEKCNKFIKNSKDSEKNAEVAFELGKFYSKNNEFEKASQAFLSVMNYSPTFETEYNSKLEYAKCLMDLDKVDEGIAHLNEMKNKSQYLKYLDEISVELGTGYYLKKDFANALETFTIVDTTYYGSKSSGVAEFMKAQIYEYHLPNFDSANTYYNYVNSNSLITEEMKQQNNKKINLFSRYISSRDEIRKNIKQMEYAVDKSLFLRDSVLYVEAVYRDTVNQRNRTQTALGGANQFANNQNQTGQNQFGNNQSTTTGRTTSTTDQQSVIPPQNAMGSQSNTNNTGLTGQTKLGLSEGQQTANSDNRRINLQRIVKKNKIPPKPEKPTLSKDSLATNLSVKLFSLANIFFTDMDLPDSASYYYNKIINEYPKKPIIPNAYFALGTYYLTIDKKGKADSLFKIVYNNYSKSDVATSAAKKLGLIEDTPKNDPAEAFYIEAEKKYYDKKYDDAIKDFRDIIAKFPKSKAAPKAAYYIAFIFENDIKNVDSTTAAYEYLNKTFPQSAINNKVVPRYNTYQEVKKSKQPPATNQPVPNKQAAPAQTPVLPAPNKEAAPQQKLQTAIKDTSKALPDSIKAMMLKAQTKDALKEKPKIKADSTKILRKEEK
jgi:TolA-binding protein